MFNKKYKERISKLEKQLEGIYNSIKFVSEENILKSFKKSNEKILFMSDGKIMFVKYKKSIHKHILEKEWDVSTEIYLGKV